MSKLRYISHISQFTRFTRNARASGPWLQFISLLHCTVPMLKDYRPSGTKLKISVYIFIDCK